MKTEIRKENEVFESARLNKLIECITWVETTSERYLEMLEVLPPEIILNGGFLVGEPMTHRTCKLTGLCKPTFDGFKSVMSDGIETFYATSEDVTIPEFKLLIGGK